MKLTHYLALLSILFFGALKSTQAQLRIIDPTKVDSTENITRLTPDFHYYYQIKNESDTAISDLYITVSPFLSKQTGNRSLVKVEINNKSVSGKDEKVGDKYGPYSLAPRASMGIEINAQLIEPGKHIGQLSFLSKGVAIDKTLAVHVKTDSSLAFSIGNIATSRNTVNPFSGRAEFWISLINESNFPQALRLPAIKEMVKVIAEDENIDPKFTGVLFNDEDGKLLNDEGLVELGAGGSKRIRMTVKGLKDPGKYTGTLRVNSAMGNVVQESDFTLLVKHGWFWASLMILLGVTASTFLKNYLSKVRPQLQVNKDIGTVAKALTALKEKYAKADARTLKVLSIIESEIEGAKEESENGQASEVRALLAASRKKMTILPEWKEGIERSNDEHLKEYVSTETFDNLAFLESVLLKAKPSSEEFQKCDTTLNSIETSLNKLIGQIPYHKRLDQLEVSLENAWQVKNVDQARISTLKEERIPRLKELLDSMKLNEADKLMTKIERELGGVVLSAKMKSITLMMDKVKGAFSKQEAKMTAAQKKAGKQELAKLDKDMQKVSAALDAGEFSEGEKMAKELSSKIKSLAPKEFESTRSLGSGLSAETLVLGNMVAPKAIELGLEQIILKPGNYDPEAIDKRIRNNDVIVSAIILVVALVFGLKLLWAEDLTWGNATDYFTALLWGLGLHQVGSGGMFGGLGSVQNRLLGAAPAAPAPTKEGEEE